MPWSPTLRRLPDPRFDPYRDRCAALYRDGLLIGHVLVLTNHGAFQSGGHLWWRRWHPDYEYLQPLVRLVDGRDFEEPVHWADLERELERWSHDKFTLLDELLDMVWLALEDTLRLAPEVFDVKYCLDNDDRPIWSFTYRPRGVNPPSN